MLLETRERITQHSANTGGMRPPVLLLAFVLSISPNEIDANGDVYIVRFLGRVDVAIAFNLGTNDTP